MKKWRNKILSAVLVLSLLLTSSSFAFAVGEGGADETSEIKIKNTDFTATPSSAENSKNEIHPISSAFDGNIDSYWHTSWSFPDTSEATGLKKSVKIVFNEAKTISKIEYTPRQDDGSSGYSNGRFNNCIVYADKNLDGSIDVSESSDDIVANVTFENTQDMKEIVFEAPIKTNALLIYAKTSYGVGSNVNSHANAAEISIYEIVEGDYSVAQVGENKYTSLSEAINAADADNPVEILKDIELDTTLNISKNVTIKSVENSVFTIKRGSGLNVTMFTVATNGNLTLDNIIIDGGADWGDFTPAENGTNSGKKGGSIIEVSGSGQLTVNSGAILQNNENIVSAGGAIKADSPNAKVHVYGKIWNNRTTGNTTNTWNNGGGIATNGKIYIYDGAVISGNNATVKSGAGVGGAIQVYGDGSLNIYGGTIENNKAGSGDNIGHSSSAPINLSGNFNIENINVNTISNKINIVDYVAENSSITIICNSITDGTKVAAIDEGVDTTNIVNAIKVDGKTTYRSGNDVKVGQAAAFTDGGLSETKTVMLNPNGNTSTTLTVETTGTDVTYKWYKCSTKDGNYEEILSTDAETLNIDSLTIGSTYYYCVIDNGDNSSDGPVKSNICEVKVSDFYPCSKAIDKFKNI